MRIARLREGVVMCQFPGCEKTAMFLVETAPTSMPSGRALVAYCEKHSREFTSSMMDPRPTADRLPCAKVVSQTVRKAAS